MKKLVDFVHKLYDWTLKWASHPQSAKILCVLSFLEASIFPVPVDPLLLAMGFSKPRRSFYYAFLSTFFSMLGAFGGYLIGSYAWSTLSPWFFGSVFSRESFDNVVFSLQGTTFVSVFIAGFSPIPFKIFTIAAGVTALPLLPFTGAVILSRGLRYFLLGGLIFRMGEKAQIWIENNFETMTYTVSAFIILTLVLFKFFY